MDISLVAKQNNKGYSLVELIVAVAVGMILSGSIAGLLAFAVRQYRNESMNVSTQYEIQTNVNQITDAIVSSQGMVIGQNAAGSPAYTDYAAFGDFIQQADGTVVFDGVVFVAGAPDSNNRFNIYMDRVSGQSGATSAAAVSATVSNIKSHMSDDPNPYLLGKEASEFKIVPNDKIIDDVNCTYNNPIVVDVSLAFEKDGSNKVIRKEVTDEAYMRNTVKVDVYVGQTGAETKYSYSK